VRNSQKNIEETIIPAVMPAYNRADLQVDHGEGAYLFDVTGRRFLDFGSGIAVNSLGHANPHLVQAIATQAGKIMHSSNLYRIPGQERLAERLVDASFADTVFFTNSGAEALECAIKVARKYQSHNNRPERYRVITFEGSFHGRTLATIAAAGQEKLLKGFGPAMAGFDHVPFSNNIADVEAALTPETAAVLIEPIQGEGGIKVATPEFMRALRAFCDRNDLLLMLDEVQCGIGRTGKFYAYELSGILPDVVASAKGIGGGFPLGACLATQKAAAGMTAGSHGSTYGGNPLAMAAGNAVLDIVLKDGFLDHVQATGKLLRTALEKLQANHQDVIAEVRGAGLMLGLKLHVAPADFVKSALDHGLLLVSAGDNVVRILPPLIIEKSHIDEAYSLLDGICSQLSPKKGN
jgi:acetylornithine/N-succinyldiaminopimelate aminotransferase